MAGKITCSEDGSLASYYDETSTFLKEEDISKVLKIFERGVLNNVDDYIIDGIKSNMNSGLSEKALNIGGRAPLNELAEELIIRLNVTVDDLSTSKQIVQAEGNAHIKWERTTYWKKVQETHKKIKEETRSAVEAYNKAVNNKNDQNRKYNENHPDETQKNTNYKTLNWDEDANFKCITNPSDWSENIDHADEVNDLYNNKLGPFEVKYRRAHEEYEKYRNLEPDSASDYSLSIPDNETLPPGVEIGAKRKTIYDDHGHKTEIYTNPDGSVVEIRSTEGKKTSVTEKNRYGYVTSETEYDSDGTEKSKTEYKYTRTDTKGVYIRTVVGEEDEEQPTYAYVDKQGTYVATKEKPYTMQTQAYDGNYSPADYYNYGPGSQNRGEHEDAPNYEGDPNISYYGGSPSKTIPESAYAGAEQGETKVYKKDDPSSALSNNPTAFNQEMIAENPSSGFSIPSIPETETPSSSNRLVDGNEFTSEYLRQNAEYKTEDYDPDKQNLIENK